MHPEEGMEKSSELSAKAGLVDRPEWAVVVPRVLVAVPHPEPGAGGVEVSGVMARPVGVDLEPATVVVENARSAEDFVKKVVW